MHDARLKIKHSLFFKSSFNDTGCERYEIRLVRFLLSNTKIKVKVNDSISSEFKSTIGGPQGDSIAGLRFTLTLAGAGYISVLSPPSRHTPPISPNGMPEEDEYSDDLDLLSEDKYVLEAILPVATSDQCV